MIVGSFGFGVVFGVAGIWLDQERRDGFALLELSMVLMKGRYSFLIVNESFSRTRSTLVYVYIRCVEFS